MFSRIPCSDESAHSSVVLSSGYSKNAKPPALSYVLWLLQSCQTLFPLDEENNFLKRSSVYAWGENWSLRSYVWPQLRKKIDSLAICRVRCTSRTWWELRNEEAGTMFVMTWSKLMVFWSCINFCMLIDSTSLNDNNIWSKNSYN